MTSPDERADNGARNAAIKQVDEALKTGRIVQADHDMRVDQLRRAVTMQDIDLQVRDLQTPAPSAPVAIAPVAPTPTGPQTPGQIQDTTSAQQWPLVNYGSPQAGGSSVTALSTAAVKSSRAIGGVVAAIILVAVIVPIAGAVIAFVASRNSIPDFGDLGPSNDATYLPGQAPGDGGVNVHTVQGYDDLVSAIKDQSHATYAFSAVLYPRYAVVEVPTGTRNRYQNFYWDGSDLQLQDIKGTSTDQQVDLSLVDPNQVISMLQTVRGRMDDATSWYVVIDASTGQPEVTAYASNDFSESTYIIEGFDGSVIYDSDKPPS